MKDPRGDNHFPNNIQPAMESLRAEWLAGARATARAIIARDGRVTADDINREYPVPKGVEPRTMGCVFRTREFRLLKYVPGARSVRQIGVYGLRKRRAARGAR